MKWVATVDGREIPVAVRRAGERLLVTVGGVEREAELRPHGRRGVFLLRLGDATRVVVVRPVPGGESLVTLGSRERRVAVEDEGALAARGLRRPGPPGPRVLRSAMPGVVRQVLVAEGAAVAAREPLLVLEAMKMQNEVRADRAGVVRRLHVAPGAAVAKGDPLVTLE
jgi:biotin carboxyl carrier protein